MTDILYYDEKGNLVLGEYKDDGRDVIIIVRPGHSVQFIPLDPSVESIPRELARRLVR